MYTTLFSVDSESMHNKLIEHQIFTDYRCTNQGRRKVYKSVGASGTAK